MRKGNKIDDGQVNTFWQFLAIKKIYKCLQN